MPEQAVPPGAGAIPALWHGAAAALKGPLPVTVSGNRDIKIWSKGSNAMGWIKRLRVSTLLAGGFLIVVAMGAAEAVA